MAVQNTTGKGWYYAACVSLLITIVSGFMALMDMSSAETAASLGFQHEPSVLGRAFVPALLVTAACTVMARTAPSKDEE